jgi:hypothetical protein
MSLRLRATLARVIQGPILPVKTAQLDGPGRSYVATPTEDNVPNRERYFDESGVL